MRNFTDCRCYVCIKCPIIDVKVQTHLLEKPTANTELAVTRV